MFYPCFFFPNLILILKENPKEVEPKSITDFEVPELAIDLSNRNLLLILKNWNPLGIWSSWNL